MACEYCACVSSGTAPEQCAESCGGYSDCDETPQRSVNSNSLPAGPPPCDPGQERNSAGVCVAGKTTDAIGLGEMSRACKTAFTEANKACVQGGIRTRIGEIAQGASGLLGSLGGGVAAQCKSRQYSAIAAALSTVLVNNGCRAKANACAGSCQEAPKGEKLTLTPQLRADASAHEACDGWKTQNTAGAAQTLAGAGSDMLIARECQKLVKGDQGVGRDYCKDNATAPECQKPECLDFDKAKSNPKCGAIYCAYNPTDTAACPQGPKVALPDLTLPSTDPLAGLGLDDSVPLDFDDDPANGSLYNPGKATAGSSGPGPGNDTNGSSGGPTGGAYPGGSGQASAGGGGAGAQFNKDIGGGLSGGGGGGFMFPGGAAGSEGGPRGAGGGGSGDQGLDLSKFLPGGELDPAKRGLASDMTAKGITGANELSNFEKVTRMMNKKRPLLKSAEGK
jgi:hypothetical protein